MDQVKLPNLIIEIAESGHIDAADVIDLRRWIYPDGVVKAHEADALFWLNEACVNRAPQWAEFFVEALADFYLNRQTPAGYIDAKGADHLATRVLRDGRVSTATELELLATLIERATSVPQKLVLFVLGEVRISVLEGRGPIRHGRRLEPGVIAAAEVDLLRRVLYGMGSHGNLKVTRLEAELLFDLNDAIADASNHAAWSDLFVMGIANYVMAAELWAPPAREDVLRREAWLEQRDGTLGFMRRMGDVGYSRALDSLKHDAEAEAAERRQAREQKIADAEAVTREEAEWLARRIGADGRLHDNERALLEFLKARAPDIHPALKALIDRPAYHERNPMLARQA